jgi:hypothetical protein
MHCGYLASECSDCASISLHSVTMYPVDEIFRSLEPSRWVCETSLGPVLPWADYPLSPELCVPPALPRPRRHVRTRVSEDNGLRDICDVDPRACPQSPCTGLESLGVPPDFVVDSKYKPWCPSCNDACLRARWINNPGPTPFPDATSWPRRRATYSDLGKPTPLARWAFPYFVRLDDVYGSGEFLNTEKVRQPVLR